MTFCGQKILFGKRGVFVNPSGGKFSPPPGRVDPRLPCVRICENLPAEMAEWSIWITGMVIFMARVVDVSMGTLRTLVTVQGRMKMAFALGLVEVTIWLYVITEIVAQVQQSPLLVVFYAFGFSTGNIVGIWVEKKLAIGHVILRLLTARHGPEMAASIRELGFRVTEFQGKGRRGPVSELYVVCDRRDLNHIMRCAQGIDPNVFYITETPGQVRRFRKTFTGPLTGWRSVLKRK
jgi:uncharacterized protein YebE (UPF0316 family)